MSASGAGSSVAALPTLTCPKGGQSISHVDEWRGRSAYSKGKKVQVSLEQLLKLPTLTATNANGNAYTRDRGEKGKERLSLCGLMRLPTLTASDHQSQGHSGKKQGAPNLRTLLPTLTASMVTPGDMEQAAFHSSERPAYSTGGGLLNPEWCEWFMGWPMGWTALKPLETARFREWRRQHSPSSPGN